MAAPGSRRAPRRRGVTRRLAPESITAGILTGASGSEFDYGPIIREQFEYLMHHRCDRTRTHCADCARFQGMVEILMAPFVYVEFSKQE